MKKILAVLALAFAAASCGNDQTPDVEFKPQPDPAFDAIAPLVQRDCGVCHNGNSGLPVFPDARAFKTGKVKDEIASGAMPPGGRISADDKAKLLAYLGG